ncbi:MAG: hypothetical protein ACR65X_09600 [Methylocystis sp.]
MTIVTKAGLAAELGITRGRVSQYVTRGLPVRNDGKLDREKSLAWIKRNVDPTTSSKGFFAAAGTRGRHHDDADNPVDAAIRLVLRVMCSTIPSVAAAAAREAGVSDEQLEKIWSPAHALAAREANSVLEMLDMPPRHDWPTIDMCRRASRQPTGAN